MRRVLLLIPVLLPLTVPAMAGTIYKCTGARGHVSYQGTPCTSREHQQVVHLHVTPGAAPPSAVAGATSTPAPPAVMAVPAPPAAHSSSPVLYRCTRATDGGTYLSRTGRTRAYLAPSAVVGVARLPLAVEYGSAQGAGVGLSAPELMPDPAPATIGSGYVWVRDACHRLSADAACTALGKRYEANERAIHDAFPDERAPLLKKRAQLRAQMQGCSR